MTGRAEQFWKAGSVDPLFSHGALKTPVPFGQSYPTKTHRAYDVYAVRDALVSPERYKSQKIDPRELRATQPEIRRDATSYYLNDGTYARTGETFADKDNPGNAQPVVFHNETNGHLAILSGHHRAVAALLRGEQFNPLVVSGKPTTHVEAAAWMHEVEAMKRKARMAAREADKG